MMNKLSRALASIIFGLMFCSVLALADQADIKAILDKAEANLLVNQEMTANLLAHVEHLLSNSKQHEEGSRLLNLQAHLDILKHHLNDAFVKAKAAEQLALKTNNTLQLAEAIRKQGIINFLLGFDADALELLTKSLKLHQQLNSEYVLNNLQAIGNVYANNINWADSLTDIGEQLVEKAVIRKNAYFEELGYGFIVSGLINQGKFEEASLMAGQALKTLENPRATIFYYAALAEVKLNNFVKALYYIDQDLELIKQRSTPLRQLSAMLLKAEILILDNQASAAVPLLQEALQQANQLNISVFQKEALQKLANYYHQVGDDNVAFDYLSQYDVLKEIDFNTKQSKQLAFSRARLELAQKNQQITELELSAQLVEQQNTYQLSFMILSCAITLLLVFMYWRTNIQKRVLKEYSKDLKHASEAKSEFLARMSHEIRTPINAVIGLTKLSRNSQLSQRQQAINLQQIEESSKTLLGVINDILDFSKIEAGKLHIDQCDFELDKVIEQSIRLQSLKTQEKNLELIQYIARDVPLFLNGDALRLQQVLNNLLSNAVKFTQRGSVSVSVNKKYSESGIMLEFEVKDTGIGLAKNQLASLFDAFTQADESITRQFGGTGLGLTICKQLVELMGGQIWAESRLGHGSTFCFTINVEEASPREHNEVISAAMLANLKVLLVDDVELSRKAAASALLRLNINPDIAENGSMAIQKLRLAVEEKSPFQLIILDWNMPDIDGIEVASIVTQEFSPKPQIIMLSAYDVDSLQDLCKPLGIEGYVQKPVNSSSLLNAIMNIANNNHNVVKNTVQNNCFVPDLEGLIILLVEDNELNRKVAKGFLADTKAEIVMAENGQIALQMLAEHPSRYGLILMDIQMPVMDGLTATYKIRNELNLQTPIIAMTAQAMKGDVEKSIAAGMNAHVTKPLDPEYLYQILQDVLSQQVVPLQLPAAKDALAGSENLAMIDTDAAMRQLRVDASTYQELVIDFINLEDKLGELLQALIHNDIDKMREIIHFYSPAVSYIGAFGLAQLAVHIEKALKGKINNISADSLAEIQRFQQATSELTVILKQRYL